MAQNHGSGNNNNGNATVPGNSEVKATTFHDFLGKKGRDSASGAGTTVRPPSEVSPAASVSLGASSCGGRGPISTTSDLGTERNASHHFEGVPFYGPRGDFVSAETDKRFAGSKRSNSDSFMASSRDKFPAARPESLENSHLMKLLRHAGGERLRRPHEDESSFGIHQIQPISPSFISQFSVGGRTDADTSKWDRPIHMNLAPSLQYAPRVGQVMPFGYQASSSRLKETNTGPSVISQTAADEGSRTGIKGSGILSSMNATGGISERHPSGVLVRSGKKSGVQISEPDSSAIPSRRGIESAGRQMTIFYGGQAHVFDNVHPNKADVIMALAGSNGGSWSTTYTPKGTAKPPTGENPTPSGETDKEVPLVRELHGRAFGSGDRVSIAPGSQRGSMVRKESRASELNPEGKHEA